MGKNFYQCNNKVLKFRVLTDKDEILFNHYLMQRENLQRIKNELPRGQFYLTISSIEEDLNLSRGIARGLIKRFENLNIITNIYKPNQGQKKPSIYAYNAVFANTDGNTDTNIDTNTDKRSTNNTLSGVANTDGNTDTNIDTNTSKKEYLKRIFKNSSSSTAAKKNYIDFFENNFHMISSHEFQILNSFINDGMNEDVIKLALERAVENNVRTISYVKAILQKWLENNIKTVEGVKAEQLEFERNKQLKPEESCPRTEDMFDS